MRLKQEFHGVCDHETYRGAVDDALGSYVAETPSCHLPVPTTPGVLSGVNMTHRYISRIVDGLIVNHSLFFFGRMAYNLFCRR